MPGLTFLSRNSLVAALLAGVVICLHTPAYSQQHDSADEAAVISAAEQFVDAFNNLNWERFEASWAKDASVFFPMENYSRRVDGRDNVIEVFRALFESLPETAEGPPYLSIQPLDLAVQMLGESAIVTFHLGTSERLNRRTIVFARHDDRWLITHLHASRMPMSQDE